ncbi:MAG: NAD(P)/FAD-dependent oxidoreductase [Acidobacteriota bacterium]
MSSHPNAASSTQTHHNPTPTEDPVVDVVILGGGFAGAAFATLLGRLRPGTRSIVLEARAEGEYKVGNVGEATVELSAFFLYRVLGLYDLLSEEHLPKHGLRYWFSSSDATRLEEMSEVGAEHIPGIPSFQLHRVSLERRLRELAVAEGAQILRPARVRNVELAEDGPHRVCFEGESGPQSLRARWVIDASGRNTILSRQLGLRRRVEEHPTAAVWGRWRGVKDLDGTAVLGADPRTPKLKRLGAARRLATNHFCGRGWWAWAIPLAGGLDSIGLVWDKSRFELPGSGSKIDRYREFVTTTPGLRELLEDAEIADGDAMSYSHLPYRTERYADRGWALVGDAAAFLDPYYSPGLDHASISIYATARLLQRQLDGELPGDALGEALDQHNDLFLRSYPRWLEALYTDKYELLGDAQLTGASFLMDTALYYLGVVSPVYRDVEALAIPLFGQPVWQATAAYKFMKTYKARLVRLAEKRQRLGLYGQRNEEWRDFSGSFGLERESVKPLTQGIKIWAGLEWETFWASLRPGSRRPITTEPATREVGTREVGDASAA